MVFIGTRLVPEFYNIGNRLAPDRYIPDWSEIGTRLVPHWCQMCTKLVLDWYQIAPTRLEHALVDDFPQTSRKLPKGFPEGVPTASQGLSKVLRGLKMS